MTPPRSYRPGERAARARLAQLLHDHELIDGALVDMARTCGKKGCRCLKGDKHVSLYLSIKLNGQRRMVYIPAALEEEVRRRVAAYREVERLTDVVSAACVERVLQRKRGRANHGKEEEGQGKV